MLAIIEQYWLTCLLGLISSGLGLLCKKFWKLYQDEKTRTKSDEQESIQKQIKEGMAEVIAESKAGDESLQGQINLLMSGVLSIQKAHFKRTCKELLKETHEITLEELESITADHSAYNGLGGNHEGDILFEMVITKANKNLAD